MNTGIQINQYYLKPVITAPNTMIGEVNVYEQSGGNVLMNAKYIKNDNCKDLQEGYYWFTACKLSIDDSFKLMQADFSNGMLKEVVTPIGNHLEASFLTNIFPGRGAGIVPSFNRKVYGTPDTLNENTPPIEVTIDESAYQVVIDYKTVRLPDYQLLSCGLECRATNRYGTQGQMLFFSREEHGNTFYYIPMLDDNGTNPSSKIDFFCIANEPELWAWLGMSYNIDMGIAIDRVNHIKRPMGNIEAITYHDRTTTYLKKACAAFLVEQLI